LSETWASSSARRASAICDRLETRGLPTRPLTDLAMLWLSLIGIRPRDTVRAAQDLRCPLLMDPDAGAIWRIRCLPEDFA